MHFMRILLVRVGDVQAIIFRFVIDDGTNVPINSVRHAADSLADEWRVCRRTLHREITERREARGGKKITRKKPAKRGTDANQPRVYDMHFGFIPPYDKLRMELMSHGDEFPIPYGIGEHRTAMSMYAPAGQTTKGFRAKSKMT